MKFGRNYRLTIQTNELSEAIVIEPPFTVEFTVSRSTMGSLNSAQFKIYNLSEKTRSRIFQDRFNPREYKRIVFQAGYGSLTTIFAGNIFQAHHARNGNNIVTFIDARDGAFDAQNSMSIRTVQAGSSIKELVQGLVRDMPNISEGNLSGISGTISRPVVLNGNTLKLIDRYTNGDVYIDLEQLNVLSQNQVIQGYVPLINSDTGLLGTPIRNDAYLQIDTIFSPEIIVGQVLEVASAVNTAYDGQYKVIGLTHSGIISEAVGGACQSRFDLLVGSQLFGGFNRV